MSEKNSKLLTELSQIRTLYSNQRTYLAYLRTGFAITALAVSQKSDIIIFCGITLILFGVYQYYDMAKKIEKGIIKYPNKEIPLVFVISGLMAVYYYWGKKK